MVAPPPPFWPFKREDYGLHDGDYFIERAEREARMATWRVIFLVIAMAALIASWKLLA